MSNATKPLTHHFWLLLALIALAAGVYQSMIVGGMLFYRLTPSWSLFWGVSDMTLAGLYVRRWLR